MKLKWKVADATTGRYRSFESRAWPMAWFSNGCAAVHLSCEDEYIPRNAREGNHAPITVMIAFRVPENHSFTWRTLKQRASTLDEAKILGQTWYAEHPDQVELAMRGAS